MSRPPSGDRAKGLLCEALTVHAARRVEYVTKCSADDEALKLELLELLAVHAEMESDFLELPDLDESLRDRQVRSSFAGSTPTLPDLRSAVLGGRYRLRERIGDGASGHVYEARIESTDDLVAVKVLSRFPSGDSAWGRREISALRLLDVPGVVRILDDGQIHGRPYVVMERIRGAAFPGAAAPVPWSDLQELAVATIETVHRMHAQGVIHGDLKPENVLVTQRGRPVIVDLGLCSGSAVVDWANAGGGAAGTLAYMPPERIAGAPPTARSDVFALALMLAEALTGHRPRSLAEREALRVRIDSGPTTAPRRVLDTLAAALSSEERERPLSAADFAMQLSSGRDSSGVRTRLRELVDVAFNQDDRSAPDGEYLGKGDITASVPRNRVREHLVSLFAGIERLQWMRSEAVEQLLERVEPDAEKVVSELMAWRRAGTIELSGSTLVIDAAALGRLVGQARWDAMRAAIDEGDVVTRVDTVARLAEDWVNCGRAGDARRLLSAALSTIRAEGCDASVEAQALEMLLVASLLESTDRALDLALHELMRARNQSSDLDRAVNLARAAQYALRRRGVAALGLCDAAERGASGPLRRVVLAVRQMACWSVPSERQQAELAKARAAHPTDGESWSDSRIAEWEGWQAYRELRFEDAIRWHRGAHESADTPLALASTALNLSSCQMEAELFDLARESAMAALQSATAMRHSLHAARAEWLLRSCLYRSGAATGCDFELLEAVEHLGSPHTAASIQLNEAAVAWRTGDCVLGRELALSAAETWRSIDHGLVEGLALGLASVCGADVARSARHRALGVARSAGSSPGVAAQVLSMFGETEEARDVLAPLRGCRRRRREVLSDCEIGWDRPWEQNS